MLQILARCRRLAWMDCRAATGPRAAGAALRSGSACHRISLLRHAGLAVWHLVDPSLPAPMAGLRAVARVHGDPEGPVRPSLYVTDALL